MGDYYTITIHKRPWWSWLLAVGWLAVELLFLQTALASHAEEEPRAAIVSWCLFGLLGLAGLVLWRRGGRGGNSGGENKEQDS